MRPSPPRIPLSELMFALECASGDALIDHLAYIDLHEGTVHCWSSEGGPDETLPDDIETSDRYLFLPDKRDLDLGRELALAFADEALPDEYRTIAGFFRQKGAYRRFKDFLDARGMLDRWYAFEERETEQALRRWCAENGIEVAEDTRKA